MGGPLVQLTPQVRTDAPEADDPGQVVRPIGGGAGGSTETIQQPSTANITTVLANLASVTLLAANPNRSGFTIQNTSATGVLYLLMDSAGSPASLTNHTVALYPGSYYETPYNYAGVVVGLWASVILAGDRALITEFIPVP